MHTTTNLKYELKIQDPRIIYSLFKRLKQIESSVEWLNSAPVETSENQAMACSKDENGVKEIRAIHNGLNSHITANCIKYLHKHSPNMTEFGTQSTVKTNFSQRLESAAGNDQPKVETETHPDLFRGAVCHLWATCCQQNTYTVIIALL